MAKEQEQQSLAGRFLNWVQDNHAKQPALGAELKAMGREAVKNIREHLVDQAWFGQRDGPGEPGAPLNPTMQETTKDRGVVGDWDHTLDTYASRSSGRGQD